MASSRSDASDRAAAAVAAAAGSLGSLCNPELANLPAAELVVRLYNNRRGSDFADVAFVLAERERRLAEAEAQIRRAGEREERLQAEVRACERMSVEPGELLPADVRGPDRTAASVGDQLEGVEAQLVGAHASGASEVEVAPLDCTPSAVEAAAGVLAMLAEAAVDLPRLSPLRTTAADALQAPAMQSETECNKENEDSGNSGHGLAIVPLGYFADATSVASEDSDDEYGWIKHLTESQMWEEFNKLKAHVAAWESELNAAEGGTHTRAAHEAGKAVVDEPQAAQGRSDEATEARRLEIVVCESEAEAMATAIPMASETAEVERLRAEITECKEKAHATEAGLWAEILARGSAIQDLEAEAVATAIPMAAEVQRLRAEILECKEKARATEAGLWAEILARGSAIQDHEAAKSRAEEAAQRQARAASEVEARLRGEIAACKREAAEAEASHRAEMKACEGRAAAAVAGLQDEIAACKRKAAEAEASHRAEMKACEDRAAAAVAGLQDEIAACKREAAEAEASHRAEMKACEDRAAAAMAGLRDDEMRRREQLAGELQALMEKKLVELNGYHTAIQNGLRFSIQARELTIQYLTGSGPSLGDEEVEAMGAQQDEHGVGGREHTGGPNAAAAAAASSSHAQASGQ